MIFSIVALIVIFLLINVKNYQIFKSQIINHTENNSIKIGNMLFEQKKKIILSEYSKNRECISINKNDILDLDKHMKKLLTPLKIVKIKIYDDI